MIKLQTILLSAIVLFCCKKSETIPVSNPCIVGGIDTCNTVKPAQLIWSDEFNTDGAPDSAKWQFESGFVRNEEAQWYQKENAVCRNGNLVITGKKERRANPN